ncbi:hypothetical protein OH687_28945 [Burkholderia anthina]|nr:hypothetical protein OH687_28945 [Burkholderia anthina]
MPRRQCSDGEHACGGGEFRIVPVVAPGDRIPPGAGEVECRSRHVPTCADRAGGRRF